MNRKLCYKCMNVLLLLLKGVIGNMDEFMDDEAQVKSPHTEVIVQHCTDGIQIE